MYKPSKLQNAGSWTGDEPTIIISSTDAGWDEAYGKWSKGQNPTNSPDWKKGVFLCFEEVKVKIPWWKRLILWFKPLSSNGKTRSLYLRNRGSIPRSGS